ncbi:MAG: right-handed parallel beta-helix repeat-containing protein, partial [Alistipes sp.]|nr:right-handed parallel beta-helix repeat-containing protein [Alistipes sp.]
ETFSGKTVTLAADIDLAGSEWTPIGNGSRKSSSYTGNSFQGTFDGQGKTVSGLSVKSLSGDAAVGLIGVLDGGTVRNVNLEVDIEVAGNDLAAGCVGLLVNGGTIEGVTVSGSVSGQEAAAGIVSRVIKEGTVRDCHNHATVTGSKHNIGGIVGAAYYTEAGKTMTIENCSNDAAITGNYAVGGIVGFSAADVKGCTNGGAISTATVSAGGIVGEQQNAGSITACVNNADIANASDGYGTGGIVGWIRYIGAESAYAFKEEIEVIGNTNYGSVAGGNDAGGIVGTVYQYGRINENKNYAATLSAKTFVGGIVGNVQFMRTDSNVSHAGMPDEFHVYVQNNYSETTLDNMTGGLKDRFVYTNDASLTTISGNTPDEGVQVTTQEQAIAAINAGGKVVVAGEIAKIDFTTLDPAAELDLVLNAKVGEIVLGSTVATTITVAKDVDYPVFSVLKGHNIENLTIIGDNTSSKACTSGIIAINTSVDVIKNVKIDGVRFEGNAINFGFTANPQITQNIVIENCVATDLVTPFFSCSNNRYASTVVGDITIRNNTCSFSSAAAANINAIYMCSSTDGDILIEGNTFNNAPKHGIMADGNACDNFIVRGNTFIDPVEDGVKIDNPVNNVVIENNTITPTEYGVRVARFSADYNPTVTITGNRIDMSSAKAIAGISIAKSNAAGAATLTVKENVKVGGNPAAWFEIAEELTVNAGSDIENPFVE